MAEFSLPRNSRVREGRAHKAAPEAKRVKTFKVYRYDPEEWGKPAGRPLRDRSRRLRADGPRRADQDQERGRQRADLPPLLPRGRLRLLRDEHPRPQHAGLHLCLRGHLWRRRGLSLAPHGGDQGPGHRLHAVLGAVRADPAVAAGGHAGPPARARPEPAAARASSTACGNASCAPAARPAARPTGGTASASSGRRRCCSPTAGSPTRATSAPPSGSTRSRTRFACTAATPS